MSPEHSFRRKMIMAALLAILLSAGLATGGSAGEIPQVVILNSYHQGYVWSDAEMAGVLERLREKYPIIDPSIENVDAKRYPGEDQILRMKDYLRSKYRQKKVDLLIVLDNPAFEMVLRFRKSIFPDAPVVFAGVNHFNPGRLQGQTKITGVAERMDIRGTLETALSLHPGTTDILVIHDYTATGLALHQEMEAARHHFKENIAFRYLPPVSFAAAEQYMKTLPEKSIALILTFTTDSLGQSVPLAESTRRLTSASRAPVYATHETRLGHGIMGGNLLEGKEHGQRAADLALKVLSGANTADIPVDVSGSSIPKFDHRQLERFNIPARALPLNSLVINRPSSFYEQNKRLVFGTVTVIPGLVCVILILALAVINRRRAEEALRKSEEKYRLLFENAGEGILIARGEYIRFANPALLEILGYPLDILTSRAFTSFIHPDDRGMVLDRHRRRLKGEKVETNYAFRIVRADGALKWLQINSRVILWEGQMSSLNFIIDVTDLKHIEASLRESEEMYRLVVENAGQAIYIIQDGLLKFANKKSEALTGYAKTDLEFRPFADFVHPDDLALVRDRHVKRLQGLEVPSNYSFRIVRRSGDTRWVELNVVFMAWGGKAATLNFLNDITERIQAEAEKRTLGERLQRAEKMEALGTLAGGVAHDLNNVLGIVVGYAELLLDDADQASPLRPGLTNIMEGGQQAAAIVQDLLTLARRGVPGRKILNLNKIITDGQHSPEFEKLASYHGSVRITTDLEPDLLNVSGSSVHLGKTLFNLVSNASEAMPNGGAVTIRTANQYIDRPIQGYDEIREGDYAVLSVSDTGDGIPEADLKRIFEPFYTKKVMGRSGTGLGLAVVWGTVKDHSGYVNVQSEEGRGSTFTLYFPVTREDITDEHAVVPVSEYLGKGESVLIVDDVKGQRDLAAGMLRKLTYNVSSAPSGEEAVDYLKNHTADLMVLDMIMDPGMDGLDTYKSVLEIHPQQKAIIVSGFSESERVQEALSLGAGAYVRKPYVMETLGLAVRKALDKQ